MRNVKRYSHCFLRGYKIIHDCIYNKLYGFYANFDILKSGQVCNLGNLAFDIANKDKKPKLKSLPVSPVLVRAFSFSWLYILVFNWAFGRQRSK